MKYHGHTARFVRCTANETTLRVGIHKQRNAQVEGKIADHGVDRGTLQIHADAPYAFSIECLMHIKQLPAQSSLVSSNVHASIDKYLGRIDKK